MREPPAAVDDVAVHHHRIDVRAAGPVDEQRHGVDVGMCVAGENATPVDEHSVRAHARL